MERIQYLAAAKTARVMVVQDSRDYQQDLRLREFYGGLLARGSYWTSFPSVVETVFLSPSEYSVGLQVVDFCVGAIAKASDLARKKDSKFFDVIKTKVTRPVSDRVQRGGLKHWP